MLLFTVTDTKKFMNLLLKDSVFNKFEARGIVLLVFTRFEINCIYDSSFSDNSEADEEGVPRYCLWGELQPVVFELIKGKKPPKLFKIIMGLSGENASEINDNASALSLTIRYESGVINVLTGCAQINFSLDKNVDNDWDSYVRKLFSENGIEISFES